MKIKVAHLTSHHDIRDNRVFYRECRSLAAAGYKVLLIGQNDRDEVRDGVQIRAVPRYRNRLERVTLTAGRVTWRALRSRAAVYHLHDPELIPWGLFLRLLGKRVVYDVHEDFSQAAAVRPWLPRPLRPILAGTLKLVDRVISRVFVIVIAERYYARNFPRAVEVLNYPNLDDYADIIQIERSPTRRDRLRLLYTGSITNSRGATHQVRLLDYLPATAELHLIGQCSGAEFDELESRAARDPRLVLQIRRDWVAYSRIVEAYAEPWLAGLAVFPDTPHYREKELTKFFEYMAAGLPIVCSDFPTWQAMVADQQVGLCVDPEDPEATAAAILWLAEHPEEACAMGERGRRLVAERFNWNSQAQALVALYRRLLKPSAAGSGSARLP